jgi:hypothetical protein
MAGTENQSSYLLIVGLNSLFSFRQLDMRRQLSPYKKLTSIHSLIFTNVWNGPLDAQISIQGAT